jgi:hypothetical protein
MFSLHRFHYQISFSPAGCATWWPVQWKNSWMNIPEDGLFVAYTGECISLLLHVTSGGYRNVTMKWIRSIKTSGFRVSILVFDALSRYMVASSICKAARLAGLRMVSNIRSIGDHSPTYEGVSGITSCRKSKHHLHVKVTPYIHIYIFIYLFIYSPSPPTFSCSWNSDVLSRSKLTVSAFDKNVQITFDMHSPNVTFFSSISWYFPRFSHRGSGSCP